MDCSYYIDTPIKATQYYDILIRTFGKKISISSIKKL